VVATNVSCSNAQGAGCHGPPRDSGPGAAAGFQIAGEELDVRAAGLEQAQLMLLAPARELAQVKLIRLAGQTPVPGEEPR
jgi:hypothetical protein